MAKVKQATRAARPTRTALAVRQARLIIGMDATAARQASWRAAQMTVDAIFREVPNGLAVQLAWYGESFHRSGWATNAHTLRDTVARVRCQAGATQVVRTLEYAASQAKQSAKVAALVLLADSFEEDLEKAKAAARQLRLLGTSVFAFQEGANTGAAHAFDAIVEITGGARVPFDSAAPERLRELLASIAAYTQGGAPALEAATKRLPGATLLLSHFKRPKTATQDRFRIPQHPQIAAKGPKWDSQRRSLASAPAPQPTYHGKSPMLPKSPDQKVAEAFVTGALLPILQASSDGGFALRGAVVAALFGQLAFQDGVQGTDRTASLLQLAWGVAKNSREAGKAVATQDAVREAQTAPRQ